MYIRILVLGPSHSGKSDFLNTFLYNMTIPPRAKPPGPRTYRYSLTFPPPAVYLEIVKSDRLVPLQGVNAVIVMDPNDAGYVERTVESVKNAAVDVLLIMVIRRKEDSEVEVTRSKRQRTVEKLIDITDRNAVYECFEQCFRYATEDHTWNRRKQLLFPWMKLRHLRFK